MNSEIIIRPARESDADAYREIRLEALKAHPAAFGADYEPNLQQPPEFWKGRVTATPNGNLYFAVKGESLIGTGGLYREAGEKLRHVGHIWGVYVREAWRGQHIAEQLIEACLDWARAESLPIAKLMVNATNAAAVRCYVRCGFSIYGIDPASVYHEGRYYDELLMARRL